MVAPVTAEAKAAMLANFDLEVNARKEKLRAMCEAQCASLRSRLERRVNRVPATKRQTPLIELLAPPPPQPKPAPAPIKAAPVKKAPTKKAPAAAPIPALAPPPKTRAAPATTTSRPTTAKAAPKPAAKPATKHATSKSVPTASLRGKKRSSDEATSEDKENVSVELAVPKKRGRAATTATKPSAVPKPAAPAARSTRAASRKTAPADVLSPKNNNTRAKSSTRSVRPR
ncbi:hypothetical protein C7974DRAFT_390884 [Boeremia exigua]|uniref:uncharacterized protein n=1 Tax=Boeremia exigua TaxID=749465 RepID=UPI001E8EBD67|nr:uncharacterized protein C7974DRAFT_390884 [Boeremia exigua]KAH6638103.1 hypothetical protein C7974DRAFT_390884 [Boeremia exigua]